MKKIILYLILVSFSKCTNLILDKKTEVLLKKCQKKYKNIFQIEYIPFELWEVNIFLKSDKVDSLAIKNFGEDVYDEELKVGWHLVRVHDKHRKFLFKYYKDRGFFVKD